MPTKKAEEKKTELKKVKIAALLRFNYQGKVYVKGEEFELSSNNAKSLIEKGFCKKA